MLVVATGLRGDAERRVKPGHATYALLARALDRQDTWTPGEHAEAWTALLPFLPLPGRRSAIDARSVAYAALRDAGEGDLDAHEALQLDPRTLREGEAPRRASLARGLRLLDAGLDTCAEGDPPEWRLPRVTTGEPVDANARLSHLVTTPDELADSDHGRDHDGDPIAGPVDGRWVQGDDDAVRAADHLREGWRTARGIARR